MAQSFDKLLRKLPELRTGNEQFRYFLMKKCFDVNILVHFFVPHVLIGIFVLINVHQKWIIVSNDFLCDTTFHWLTGNREMLERLHKFGRYIEKNVDISWEFSNDRCRRTVRRVHETFFSNWHNWNKFSTADSEWIFWNCFFRSLLSDLKWFGRLQEPFKYTHLLLPYTCNGQCIVMRNTFCIIVGSPDSFPDLVEFISTLLPCESSLSDTWEKISSTDVT